MIPRRFHLWIACFALSASGVGVSASRAGEVRFNRDIRPILISHCTACHGGVKQAGDLSFVYPEQVLPPEGWVVEPGEPDESALLDRVTETDPELRMPPPDHGPALSEREVGLLRDWIAQGAPWQDHWAFEPPTVETPPEADADWARRDLDRFVLARLKREGLAPSADAEPRRWLRRVSLDLIGLPPSPEELAEFRAAVEADGEAAYEAAVDRLLGSHHFGERWASVWLDQVRYADSKGLGSDAPRNAWKFRDWVIDAFNADLPFDRFTVKQLAGDLLPNRTIGDLVATAAHRLTQTNEEGGTDDEEFRIAAVLDRVNTTWQVWQGVTFGCVQCHSHPYDPFRHDEYYRFAAFFNNTIDTDLGDDTPTIRVPLRTDLYDRATKLMHEIDATREQLWDHEYRITSNDALWQPATGVTPRTKRGRTKMAVKEHEGRQEFHTVGTRQSQIEVLVDFEPPSGMKRVTALRVTGMPLDPEKALTDSEWGFTWSHVQLHLIAPDSEEPNGERPQTGEPQAVEPPAKESDAEQPKPTGPPAVAIDRLVADEPNPSPDPQESLNADSKFGFGPYSRIYRPRTATLLLAEPIELPDGARLRLTLTHRLVSGGAFGLTTNRGYIEVSDSPSLAALTHDEEAEELREELRELIRKRNALPSATTPILAERPAGQEREQHVFIRGLYLDKGERVEPATPKSFPELATTGEGPSRLDLAEWLVSDDNPLTARVAANRFWSRLFGAGLVETEEDFGSSGEAPSHPALLDHLAVRFQHDFDWSVKRLLREITLSSTYRQTSKANAALYERDPRNRLLARGPRHRLQAELIRDQALAVSGLLDRKLHGPPVRPPIPGGVWVPFTANDKWPATEPGDPARYRRSLYTYTKRSIPYPMFASFDTPSREVCTPRRLRSNTPLQALAMLNNETMVECAAALADRMRSHAESPTEQIEYGFLATVGRPPTERETAILLALHERHGGNAGLPTVAAALLNLDEFVMK